MIKLHKLIATFFGIGYMQKGAGTVAAVVVCIIWLFIPAASFPSYLQLSITAFVCIVGILSGNVVDPIWGKDSNKVVIDEVAGMMITLLFLPDTWKYIVTGLVLFRFFDILKPLGIRRMEAFPKGWGVMADDILAGLYAHIVLMAIAEFKLL